MTTTELTQELRASLSENFTKFVRGYHMVNTTCLKESPWEDINAQILAASGILVESQSDGSHQSGADLFTGIGALSNKSGKYEKKGSLAVSSYRLSAVTNNKNPGTIEEVIAEIHRRNNFKYYSIIARTETATEFSYDWLLIPHECPELDPSSYTWTHTVGQSGKSKGEINGWKTNEINGCSMTISFSMSSQFWIKINMTEQMRQYVVSNCTVSRERKLSYSQLFDMMSTE